MILNMTRKEGLIQYLDDVGDFIDGYTFKTFSNDFSKYDADVQEKFIKKGKELINEETRKREKKSKKYL